MPWFHRRGRFSYCKLRRITEQFIDKWKKKRQADWQVYNALKNSWEGNLNLWRNVLEFNPMLQTTRHWLQNDVFGKIGFPTPRIVTGDGRAAFLKTELWPGGPSLSQLTGDAVPDLDTIGVLEHKDRVWDFWLTDYDPDFWMHVFEGGGTLGKPRGNTSHGGKGKVAGGASSSNGDGQGLSLDLPRSSWLVFHGTSFHSGLCAICGNSLNRSESKRGKPSPGDAKAQEVARQTHGGRYETTAGRGVYCTQDWEKAYSYSLPFTDRRVSGIVLLLRVPGSLEDVGVTLSLGMAKHRTVRTQKDLDGNVMHLDSNWALFSRTNAQELADSVRGTKESIEKNLFNRAVRKPEEEMKLVDVIKDAMNQTIPLDTELNKRNDRHAMQADADKSHIGERRWTNIDQCAFEVMSSHDAVVGFFVGYGPAESNAKNHITLSRNNQAEVDLDWDMVPPFCRPDDIVTKNAELARRRQVRAGELSEYPPPADVPPDAVDASDGGDDTDEPDWDNDQGPMS